MGKAGRNDPCPCGSGKKYKKCCLERDQLQQQQQYQQRRQQQEEEKLILEQKTMSLREIETLIKKGYKEALANAVTKACTIWEEAWRKLKEEVPPGATDINEVDAHFGGTGLIYNWCQEYEQELHNAGLEDPAFIKKRIAYSREFVEIFPGTDSLIIENMGKAEAESLFALGKQAEGERKFERLVQDFPGSAWVYIDWADMYYLNRRKDKIPKDHEKAEKIYREALTKNIDDREAVLERLKDLEKERNKSKG